METRAPAPPTEEDPRRLVEQIQAHDHRAETQLVERYGRAVRLLLERHTRRRSEAEDLFQDTFLLAFEKLRQGELRQPEKLPGFLAALARNLAIEFYRKAARRRTEPDSETLESLTAAAAGPLDDVLSREHVALVRRALDELRNIRDRELLFRFYLAEEDKEQIAADHGLSVGQFNRVLHRARLRYKELLVARFGDAVGEAGFVSLVFLAAIFSRLVPPSLLGRSSRGT